eukprot:COSAG01_NODE_2533_length_7491_cov_236.560741_6_plen_120_part_00
MRPRSHGHHGGGASCDRLACPRCRGAGRGGGGVAARPVRRRLLRRCWPAVLAEIYLCHPSSYQEILRRNGVLAEIYLCDPCSCQEILRQNGAGQGAGARPGLPLAGKRSVPGFDAVHLD